MSQLPTICFFHVCERGWSDLKVCTLRALWGWAWIGVGSPAREFQDWLSELIFLALYWYPSFRPWNGHLTREMAQLVDNTFEGQSWRAASSAAEAITKHSAFHFKIGVHE